MPEPSNTVAVVTGRRIGLGRAKALAQTRRLLSSKHNSNRAGNAPTSRPRSPTLTWPRSADAVHTH
jgi:hypothetical protein